MDAQQLSSVCEKVLRRFGEVGLSLPSVEQCSPMCLEHLVRVALGGQGAALIIGADSTTAALLASRMFERSILDLQRADWIDALSELGNILAGKLENTLGSTRSLGIPIYLSGSANPAIWQTMNIEAEVWSSFSAFAIYIAVITDHLSPSQQ